MAINGPSVGTTQLNPNTLEMEIWNGQTWIVSPGKFASTIAPTYVAATLSSTERELVFNFLKDNLRVAEYVDKDNKVVTVQLEIRLGPEYTWEKIRREKTYNSL